MGSNYNTKNFSDNINVDVDSRTISGYAAAFNSLDSDGDVIVKGAFTKTLLENGVGSIQPRIFHLYQHDVKQVLGRPLVLKEDDYGLYFETKIAKTSIGNDVLELYRNGTHNEHSIGFKTIKSTNRGNYNEISEVKLFEFSTVTFGANSNTPFTGFKSQFNTPESITEQFELIEKMLKGEMTPDTISLLNIYLNQFKSAFIDLSTKSVDAPDPLKDSLEAIYPTEQEIKEAKKANDEKLIKAFMQAFKKTA